MYFILTCVIWDCTLVQTIFHPIVKTPTKVSVNAVPHLGACEWVIKQIFFHTSTLTFKIIINI